MVTDKRITTNPSICHGQPCIRNKRYPVEVILELIDSGMTFEDILLDFPDLEKEDLLACIEYSNKLNPKKRNETSSEWVNDFIQRAKSIPKEE